MRGSHTASDYDALGLVYDSFSLTCWRGEEMTKRTNKAPPKYRVKGDLKLYINIHSKKKFRFNATFDIFVLLTTKEWVNALRLCT